MRSIFPLLRGQISFYYFCDTKLFAKHNRYSNFPFMLSVYIYARHGVTKKEKKKTRNILESRLESTQRWDIKLRRYNWSKILNLVAKCIHTASLVFWWAFLQDILHMPSDTQSIYPPFYSQKICQQILILRSIF